MDRNHGPENAEHELRKAYNSVVDTGTTHFLDRKLTSSINPEEVVELYQHAYKCFRNGKRLAAERWARTAKHLSRAFWHEAKIAYLEPKATELPYLLGATEDEYNLHERLDTTADLLNSLENHVPAGMKEMPEEIKKYLSRARKHLEVLADGNYQHELLRAERIKAAHEYGRVIECIALAFEADSTEKIAA